MSISPVFSYFRGAFSIEGAQDVKDSETKIISQRAFNSQQTIVNRDLFNSRVFLFDENSKGLSSQFLLHNSSQGSFGYPFFYLVATKALFSKSDYCELNTIVQQILKVKEHFFQGLSLLKEYREKSYSLEQLSQNLKKLQGELKEKDLEKLFQEFSTAEFPLCKEDLSLIFEQYRKIWEIEKQLEDCSVEQWLSKSAEIQKGSKATAEEELRLLAIGRKVMKSKYGIYPYATQILAVLGLLYYPSALKGRIAQIYTGEGKSTVIALLALVYAFRGKTVDIVSSSRYLAKRDAEKYAPFFREFYIAVSHICEDQQSEEQFRSQILYGTNFDFEFAWMRDQLQLEKKRINRNKESRAFEVVIVDEVDNLFIDSALSVARIGISALVKTAWVYDPIFRFVNAHATEAALAILATECFPPLLTSLREYLRDVEEGRHRESLETIEDEQLKRWVEAAYRSLHFLQENRHYLVKAQERKIVIVDWSNTGRLKEQSRWQSGIHEFLEIKHKLPIKEENLTASSLSHPVYFSSYQTICGLTGTIGSNLERKEIEDLYSVDSFAVPSHRKEAREIFSTIFALSQEDHYAKLIEEIQEIQNLGRAILLLWETIQDTIDFSHHLREKQIAHQLLNEKQEKEESVIIAQAGLPKMVTLATNTAGRGTDIRLHPSSLERGGLHVVFAFFPQNMRVEAQGFGRAGRQGQRGSGRIILQSDKELKSLVEQRDNSVATISNDRRERVAVERLHHEFLELFWQQLQEFYQRPSLTYQGINNWLSLVAKEDRKFASFKAVEELFTKLQKPPFSSAKRDFLEKVSKASLGLLAQQCWAHFFYGPLVYIEDGAEMKLLYENERSKWEGIFHIQ